MSRRGMGAKMARERKLNGNERFMGNDELVRQHVRTFEMLAYVSEAPDVPAFPAKVELDDLPSHMQDQLAAAMEQVSERVGLKLTVVHCVIDEDHDYKEGVTPSKWFMHIVLSEVIVAQETVIISGGGA